MTPRLKFAHAVRLLRERPHTASELAVAMDVDVDVARSWIRALRTAGVALPGPGKRENRRGCPSFTWRIP